MITNLFSQLFTEYQNQPPQDIAQLPADATAVCDLFEEIKPAILNALQQGETEKADQLTGFAEAIANQTHNSEHYALAAWCNVCLNFNRNIAECVKYQEKALRFYKSTGQSILEARVLIGYAGQLTQLGRIIEAEQSILRAIECLTSQPDYRDWPVIYLNLACVQLHQGQYEGALDSAQKSETLAQDFARRYAEQGEYYKSWETQAIINQALAALLLGQLEVAAARLKQALDLAEPYLWYEIKGRARLSLARVYTFQGHLFTALEILKQADCDFKTAGIDFDRATASHYQADIYRRLMMPVQARDAAEQAAESLHQAGVVAESVEAYLVAAQIALSRYELQQTKHYLQSTEPLLPHVTPSLQALWQGYAAHIALHNDDSARQQALQKADQATTTLQELGAQAHMLTVALIAADLAAQLGMSDAIDRYKNIIRQSKAHRLADLEQQACTQLASCLSAEDSIQPLRRAADILVHKREHMPVEELKANLISGSAPLYRKLIEAMLNSNQMAMATETLLEAKGGIWSDLLAPSSAPISIEWAKSRAEFNYWQEEARGSTEPAYLALCKDKIAQAKQTLAEVARTQHKDRMAHPLPEIEAIQSKLNPQQVVLEYFVGSQQIWACLISKQTTQWFDLGPRSMVERCMSRLNLLEQRLLRLPQLRHRSIDELSENPDIIAEIRRQASQHQQTIMQHLLRQLYDGLIAPILSQCQSQFDLEISQLFIAPDTYTFGLPWAAFYDGHHYLGQRYNLTLLPSATLLASDHSVALSTERRGRPLLLGYQGNPPLQHLERSLTAIRQIWPTAKLINPASTHDLSWNADRKSVPQWLHIGAHGRINSHTPLFSQLDLADGPLLLADIFNLDLHGCDLVVLSACSTGRTPDQGGVLLALAGAFLCAGAKNVIASLWPVDDQATTMLMKAFYAAYQTGVTPTEALRIAQEQLRTAGYEHPFYWAAFQLFAREM